MLSRRILRRLHSAKPASYLFGGGIQLGAIALTPVRLDAEAITPCSWEDVQVNVEDLLEGGTQARVEGFQRLHVSAGEDE